MERIQRLLNVLGIQTSGYRPRVLTTDLSLGLINGADYVLWGYAKDRRLACHRQRGLPAIGRFYDLPALVG
jgi:hypothetical protein